MEVAAALLDASRKLTEKDVSTGNVSTTSGSSWTSSNTEVRSVWSACHGLITVFQLAEGRMASTAPTSWFSSTWAGAGQRKR